MGKLQSDKLFVPPLKKQELPADTPPQIPPRMKKKVGPALPEKPPHIRAKTNQVLTSSQQPPREPLRPRPLNLDRPQREVLVAASKSGRERPVDKRQREPAKLLMPTAGSNRKEPDVPRKEPSKALLRLEEILPTKKDPLWLLDDPKSVRKSRPLQPVLLIPRNLLTWGSAPVSYALWTQRDMGRGVVKPVRQTSKSETSGTSTVRLRSGSVTRSGSLTSQGSSGSDSGGETFPKSVLKKQRRAAAHSKGPHGPTTTVAANRRVDQKKNVTFNAFATVRLMEE